VDIDGTFHLSTADYIEFSDGSRYFSDPSATSTLSTSDISSFGFLGDSSGAISIDSSRAPSGVVDSAEYNLNVNSEFITIRDADLHAQEIGVRMGDSTFGNINVADSLLETDGGSIFFQGGTVYVVDTLIAGYGSEGSGDGATVQLTASTITLSNAEIRGEATGLGSGSDILFDATTISIGNGSAVDVSSKSALDNGGDAGTIRIAAQNVNITDAELLLDTLGGGLDLWRSTRPILVLAKLQSKHKRKVLVKRDRYRYKVKRSRGAMLTSTRVQLARASVALLF
jgi:hypothetical protein